MNHLLVSLAVLLLFGAGCARTEPIATGPSQSPNPLCGAPPMEDESGVARYPVAPEYKKLPHLGQIYTALDCGLKERALLVVGIENETYVDGVRVFVTDEKLTDQDRTVLTELHFEEEGPGDWKRTDPMSLDEILKLKPLLTGPATNEQDSVEDCILCG